MKAKANITIWLMVSVFLAVAAVPATGKTIYVNPGGSIQAAIDDPTTLNGDVIEVAPGTYNEAINFNGKAVRLYSIGGPEVTTIDGTGNYHVVQCVSGEGANTILEGFTITGGNANGPEWPNDKNGGGMYCLFSSPTVVGCRFSGNTGEYGGGLASRNSGPTVTNCTFTGNSGEEGGGLYNILSPITVTNCIFTGNSAGHGGGINNDSTQAVVTNCLFSANTSTFGGGMYNLGGTPTVTNCTFTGNSAPFGGGIDNYNSNPIVTNCILWGNTPDAIRDGGSSSTTATYSDVQGGWPGTGNIDANPLFVNAAGGDLRLSSSTSPCVDTADNNVPNLPSLDLAGNPRVVDGDRNGTLIVDMGAYEFQSWLIHNITRDHWYETIQAAINAAANGDEIEVAPGTYNEAINFKGKTIRLYSSGGPEVTTIDGTGAYHVVQCVSGEGANTILEGFTITGGNANGAGNDRYGGGMFNNVSSPTVLNCVFTGNAATAGGGMDNENSSSPTITNCTFSNNTARFWGGGGMSNSVNSSPMVTNCTFSGNSADHGGGMNNYFSSPMVTNCTFIGNSADGYGGGMTNINLDYPTDVSSSPTVTNCIFSNNSAGLWGGGMFNIGDLYNNVARPNVTNCIFIGNMAGTNGGGMRNSVNSSPMVTNCILWGDTPDEIFNSDGTSTVTYSNVEGGWGGTGNIDADPCFVDSGNPDPNVWNLRLKPDSPCIDAGDTTAVPGGIWADLDGNPRVSDNPEIPDTGISILGATVDMGVYEFQPCRIAGDINCDGVVNFKDVAILAANWLEGTEPEL